MAEETKTQPKAAKPKFKNGKTSQHIAKLDLTITEADLENPKILALVQRRAPEVLA